MRHFIVIVMIALLPLRSWAGDLMALSMTTHGLQGASIELVTTTPQSSDEIQDCAGHPSSQSNATDTEAADNGHCKTCVSCQICHSVALVAIAPVSLDAPELHNLMAASAFPFASASLADTVKPPIS